MASAPPALPWAQQQQPVATASTTAYTGDLQPCSLAQLGLQLGARLEVKWRIEPEQGEPFSRWWGASVAAEDAAGPASTSGRAQQQHVYQLKYDPWGEDFGEEACSVLLLSEHKLWDIERRDVMAWRVEGHDYEPASDDEDDGEAAAAAAGGRDDEQLPDAAEPGDEAEGGTVSLKQLASSITDEDVAASDADLLSRLHALAPDDAANQARMAAGYRDFMDNFKAFVAAKASCAEGGDVLITSADVDDFKAMMATQLAARR